MINYKTAGIFRYKENIIRITLITITSLSIFYLIFFAVFKLIFPMFFTLFLCMVYIASAVFLFGKIRLHIFIYILLAVASAHIILASLFIMPNRTGLHYIFIAFGPIVHTVMEDGHRLRKFLISFLSLVLMLLFEFLIKPLGESGFSAGTVELLRIVTLCGTYMLIIIPISLFSRQIRYNERSFYSKSIQDPLTELFNREFLRVIINRVHERSVRYKHSYVIMLIDIDFFKKVNDNFGHNAGDSVLIKFSNLLKSSIRKIDFAIRYGGEEFLLILPETNLKGGLIMAERIREKTEKMDTGLDSLNITVSLGLAEGPQNLDSPELIKAADKKLYLAKKNGRNRIEV